MTKEIIDKLIKFRDDRNWKQFHTGENLAKSICLEAAELLEIYQWSSEACDIERVKEELADVLMYSLMLAQHYDLDVNEIILNKMEKNAKKYPIEFAYGNSKKYTEK